MKQVNTFMIASKPLLLRGLFILFTTFIIFLSVNSCKPKADPAGLKPEVFLSEQQMIELITDISLAEAGINYLRNTNKPIDEFKEPLFSVILKKHGVTLKIFEDNLNWYNKDPETIEKIYDQALKNLEETKAKAASEKEEEQNKPEKTD